MIVRSTVTDGWLTSGRAYHVLSIERGPEGTKFRIQTNERSDGTETVTLHSAKYFDVITHYRPSSWREWVIRDLVVTSPAAWQMLGFLENLYDGDPTAELIFKRERALIFEEESLTEGDASPPLVT